MNIQAQPQAGQGIEEQLKTGHWSHGLFGCFDNLGVCCVAYFVPCVTFGQTRKLLTGSGCCLYGCLWTIPFVNIFLEVKQRAEIRQRRGIPGGMLGDCCMICWCTLCTLVQEEQEAMELVRETAALQAGMQMIPAGATAVIITSGATQPAVYPPQNPQYNVQYATQPQYPPGQPPPYNEDFKGQEMSRE